MGVLWWTSGCGDFGFSAHCSESAVLRTHVKQGRKHGDLVHGQSSFLCTRDNLVVVERNTGPVCGGKGKGLEWSGKEGGGWGSFSGAFPRVGNLIERWLQPVRCSTLCVVPIAPDTVRCFVTCYN